VPDAAGQPPTASPAGHTTAKSAAPAKGKARAKGRNRSAARKGKGAPAIASASSSRVAAPPAQPLVDSAADPIAKTDALIAPEAIFAANGSAGLGLPGARAWQKPVPFHRQAYAAIDLGTNNCRLLIARPAGAHFVVIDAFSRVVRLGEGWRNRAACLTRRWIARWPRCMSARKSCASATSTWRARWRPRRAAAPATAPSSLSGCIAKPASG
jgi:exopolyphosphatase/guanosine-5'-triphosphate,3'-diphosphate pyrophosphatase